MIPDLPDTRWVQFIKEARQVQIEYDGKVYKADPLALLWSPRRGNWNLHAKTEHGYRNFTLYEGEWLDNWEMGIQILELGDPQSADTGGWRSKSRPKVGQMIIPGQLLAWT